MRVKKIFGGAVAVIVLVSIWWLASVILQKNLLPTPWIVLQRLPELISTSMLLHLKASFYRVVLGLFFSILGGFTLGLMIGSFPDQPFFDAIVYLIYPIPKMALLPIVMLLGGLGDRSKVLMIVLIVLPQMTISVRDAIREIPHNYYDVYQCLRASRWRKFFHITFPATLPAIFSGTRVSLGTAISILFFTENYGTQYGMGYFIMDAWTRMDYPGMYAGILVLSSFGCLLFIGMDSFANLLFKWQK